MKKIICFILVFTFILSITGCSQSDSDIEVSTFSYSEHTEIYKESAPGVKHNDFTNTNESKIANADDALERAKNECTIKWDTFEVSFDNKSNVWMVLFYTEGMLGSSQSVYLDSDGKTLLIVYGE